MKIAILGAGVSGLATAHHLQTRGNEVTVFEGRDRVGGNIRSDWIDGCLVEWGPNGFLDNEPATLELVRDIGLTDRLVQSRQQAARRYIWRHGKLRLLPSKPQAFLTSDCLPFWQRLRVLTEPWAAAAPDGDESVYDFARRRLGRGAADILVDAFATGIYAGDVRRLSLASAFPKLATMQAEHGSLLRAAKRGGGGGHKSVLHSFTGGMQDLVDALAKNLDVRLGQPLRTLPEGYDHVVITTPAPRAADFLGGEAAELLRRIPCPPVVVVALAFTDPLPVDDAFGFLVPRGQGLRLLGTLYSSSIFGQRAPAGQRLFRVLLGGRHDPEILELSDDEIFTLVGRELRQVWGVFPDPVMHHIIRHPLGIAQYEIGHRPLLQEIEAACPSHVRLAGSSFRGVALNACVAEARSWIPDVDTTPEAPAPDA